MQLAGRTALVTGAGVRLGRAIAEGLAEQGASLRLHASGHHAEAEALAEALRARGRPAEVLRADLRDPRDLDRLVEFADRDGGIDLLVLSAAVYPRVPLDQVEPESFAETLQINLTAPALLGSRAGLGMKRRGRGAIVTLLDWSMDHPVPEYLAYTAAKAGLRAVTLGLARALAPEVRVNGVSPGAVLLPEAAEPDFARRVAAATPLGHVGEPRDVVEAVCYLATAEFVTGSILTVDGGRTVR